MRPIGDWSMLMILSTWSDPVDPVVRPRAHPRPVQAVGDRAVEDLVDQRRLARPRDAGDRGEGAEREARVDPLEVVLAGAADDDLAPWPPPLLRDRDLPLAGEELAGQRAGLGLDLRRGALGDHLSPVLAGAGTEVDDVVRRADRALVVLDHDHRVAEVAQALERPDQLLVVALVQTDRGLVEDVEDADQARPDLGREPDPLRLAARERGRRALQREVADPDRVEEAQPLGDLAHDQPRDRPLGLGQLEPLDPVERRPRRELVYS